ncbi:CobD/CbiB family protein [Methylobacillus flagellatus]|uniref:CobD/CbiB family protein n=1 Tax=Methylobacillus flagellatus TaxID=405 RepID=UPI0010F7D335|nr:CobD/CbiB family protein [Methylobacillus flagellatus]
MKFLALLGALALSYYKPHQKIDLLQQLYAPYARWLEHNCNDGRRQHGIIAWLLGVLLPVAAVAAIYYALFAVHALLGIVFGMGVLYLTLRISQFGRRAEGIASALQASNMEQARTIYNGWEGADSESYSGTELARAAIETVLRRSHQGLFGPVFWFAVLGPAGAFLYRLAHLARQEWQDPQNPQFSQFTERAFHYLDWLPARITAGCFAIVGDFEDAVYCWRMQSASWGDKSLGILLASGAGALGVKLGQPLPEQGVLRYRPEIGLGDDADADYLRSSVGLVWRVLVLMVGLLFLLTFANWLGH